MESEAERNFHDNNLEDWGELYKEDIERERMHNWKHNYEKINLYLDKRISQEELANIMKFCKEDVFKEDEVNNVLILGDRKFYIDKVKTIADNYKVFVGLYE